MLWCMFVNIAYAAYDIESLRGNFQISCGILPNFQVIRQYLQYLDTDSIGM